MFGQRLREIRIKNNLSLEKCAKLAKLSADEQREIEEGGSTQGDRAVLSRLAEVASGADTYAHCELLKHLHVTRQFQAYCVCAGRTGSLSMAALFTNFRSQWQYKWEMMQDVISLFHSGSISRDAFKKEVCRRDIEAFPEMDSTWQTIFYLDILIERFPSAKFICLIRDCYSWINSVFNLLSFPMGQFTGSGRYSLLELKDICMNDRKRLLDEAEDLIVKPLLYWQYVHSKVMAREKLYPERFLTIRTHELTHKLPEIAIFLNIPVESLRASLSHQHKTPYIFSILHEVDPSRLKPIFDLHCTDVMKHFFPGYDLDAFLSKPRKDQEGQQR